MQRYAPLRFAAITDEDLRAGFMPKRQFPGTSGSSSSTTSTPRSTTPPITSSTTPALTTTPVVPVSSSVAITTTSSVGGQDPVSSSAVGQESTTASISTTDSGLVSSSSASPSSSQTVVVGSTTIDRATLSSQTIVSTPLVDSSTSQSTYTSFWTSDGVIYSSVASTQEVVSSTTGFGTATILPSLVEDNNGGTGGGLSDQNKQIIGGVVGGVGGAIVVGIVAFLAWKWWAKRRQPFAMDDYDPHNTAPIGNDKTTHHSTPSTAPLNPASNF